MRMKAQQLCYMGRCVSVLFPFIERLCNLIDTRGKAKIHSFDLALLW